MTTKPIYVGIENELQLWRKDAVLCVSDWLWQVQEKYQKPVHKIGPTAVRTVVGSALYVDEEDPEICTPPVRVKKGFTRQAADLLYLARQELVEVLKEEKDIGIMGYSAHYNLTNPLPSTVHFSDGVSWPSYDQTFLNAKALMRYMAIPYSLLALTPLSLGTNMRIKDHAQRLELMGDYIEELDQVRALLLFYAGTTLDFAQKKRGLTPKPRINCFEDGDTKVETRYNNYVENGRDSVLSIRTWEGTKKITAQDYLERCFKLFHETFQQIGDEEEVRNLEDFVRGRKELEVDKAQKYFIEQKVLRNHEGFVHYHPEHCLKREDYAAKRAIPTNHAKFMGCLANQDYKTEKKIDAPDVFPWDIGYLSWSKIIRGESIPASFREWHNHLENNCAGEIISIFGIELTAEILARTPRRKQAEVLEAIVKLPEIFQRHIWGNSSEDDHALMAKFTEREDISDKIKQRIIESYQAICTTPFSLSDNFQEMGRIPRSAAKFEIYFWE